MQMQSTQRLYNYWNELRGTRSAPERRDVDPTKIRNALANTFILEANEEHDAFTFRLAGSHICSTYCRELKNRSFSELWHRKDRDAIDTLIKAVTDDHAAALVTFNGTSQHNAQLTFETILLPLRHNGATNNRIIGSITAFEEPLWFGTQPILEQRITGLRLIWPDDHHSEFSGRDLSTHVGLQPEEDVVDMRANFGQSAKVFGINARRYAHLSVIDGGKQ
jgi:hypothetical protein